MTQVSFVRISHNKKTGPIPVSSTEMSTCPSNCSFKNNGCYAEYHHVGMHWRRLSAGETGMGWHDFCNQVRNLPKGTIWRHNAAGDLPGDDNAINHAQLDMLVKANKGKRGFTFTHKPVGFSGQPLVNARAIYAANKNGLTVNLSADNLAQVDEYVKLGIAPIVTVLPKDTTKAVKTPAGNHVIVCPAVVREDIQCVNCRICTLSNRKAVVGFPAHGVKRNAVSQLVQIRKQ